MRAPPASRSLPCSRIEVCRGSVRRRLLSGPSPPSSLSAVRPVSTKNTSSSEGWRTSTSSTETPAASRARTTNVARPPRLETGAVTRLPPSLARGGPSTYGARAAATTSKRAPALRVSSRRAPPTLRFSSAGVPSAMDRPWSTTTTRSASWSASSRYWVVSRTVTPPEVRSRMMSHTPARLVGSRPVVGSSRKRTGGAATREVARSSLRRMPPE